jgi:hypothetical protein
MSRAHRAGEAVPAPAQGCPRPCRDACADAASPVPSASSGLPRRPVCRVGRSAGSSGLPGRAGCRCGPAARLGDLGGWRHSPAREPGPPRRRSGARKGHRLAAVAAPGAGLGRREQRRGVRHRQPGAGQPHGETFGYLLTAAWTGLVLVALGARFAGRLFVGLGGAAAVLILWGCSHSWRCRSSTSPTSSATCCGASGC